MVDMVVHRHNLRPTIGQLISIFTNAPAPAELVGSQPAKAIVPVVNAGADDLAVAPPEAAHAE